jgi:hypothetical protein
MRLDFWKTKAELESFQNPEYHIFFISFGSTKWQLINYWDDCHFGQEMNFQSAFECENAWSGSGRAGARNQIRKERF